MISVFYYTNTGKVHSVVESTRRYAGLSKAFREMGLEVYHVPVDENVPSSMTHVAGSPEDVRLISRPPHISKEASQIQSFRKLPPIARVPRLTLVVPHLFLGGAETQLYYLANELEGYDLRLVVLNHREWQGSSLWSEFESLMPCAFLGDITNATDKLAALVLEMEQSDLVLFHGTTLVSDALKLMRVRPAVFQIVHTADYVWSFNVYRDTKPYLDGAICVADWIAERLRKEFGNDPRIGHIWNGVDAAQFAGMDRAPHDGLTLGYIGRIVGGKNVDALIESLQYLEGTRVVIQGWGDDLGKCRRLAEKYPGRVAFRDASMDRVAFFRQIDALCLASDHEGNSMTIIEAVLAGLPVIASSVGAVPELMNAGMQFAVPVANTPAAIAEAAKSISNVDTEMNLEMARKSLTAKVMADQYKGTMRSALSAPRKTLLLSEGGLGDLLLSTPTIRAIREQFPNVGLELVAKERYAELIECLPLFDKVHLAKNDGALFEELRGKYDTVLRLSHEAAWNQGGHIIDRRANAVGVRLSPEQRMPFLSIPEDIRVPDLPDRYVLIHRSTPFACKTFPDDWWDRVLGGIDIPIVEIGLSTDAFHPLSEVHLTAPFAQAALACRNAEQRILIDSVWQHVCAAMGVPATVLYSKATHPGWCGYDLHHNVRSTFDCELEGNCHCAKNSTVPCPFDFECVKYLPEGW